MLYFLCYQYIVACSSQCRCIVASLDDLDDNLTNIKCLFRTLSATKCLVALKAPKRVFRKKWCKVWLDHLNFQESIGWSKPGRKLQGATLVAIISLVLRPRNCLFSTMIYAQGIWSLLISLPFCPRWIWHHPTRRLGPARQRAQEKCWEVTSPENLWFQTLYSHHSLHANSRDSPAMKPWFRGKIPWVRRRPRPRLSGSLSSCEALKPQASGLQVLNKGGA